MGKIALSFSVSSLMTKRITATGIWICEQNVACLAQSFMTEFSQLFAWVLHDKRVVTEFNSWYLDKEYES